MGILLILGNAGFVSSAVVFFFFFLLGGGGGLLIIIVIVEYAPKAYSNF